MYGKITNERTKTKENRTKIVQKNSTKPGRHICIDNGKYFRVEII